MTAYQSFRHFGSLRAVLCLAVAALLSACSAVNTTLNTALNTPLSVERLGLYKPEVVQGNFVSREQRQALRVGMGRAQVKDILGTPLVTSLFHGERWDYVFTIRRQGVAPQSFRLTVFFRADALSQIEGDDLPSENEFVQRLVGDKKISTPPVLQASEEDLRKFPPSPTVNSLNATPPPPLPSSYPPLEPASR